MIRFKKFTFILLLLVILLISGCKEPSNNILFSSGYQSFISQVEFPIAERTHDLDNVRFDLQYGVNDKFDKDEIFSDDSMLMNGIELEGVNYKFHSVAWFAVDTWDFYLLAGNTTFFPYCYYTSYMTIEEMNEILDKPSYRFFCASPIDDYQNIENITYLFELTKEDFEKEDYRGEQVRTSPSECHAKLTHHREIVLPRSLFKYKGDELDSFIKDFERGYTKAVSIFGSYVLYSQETNKYLILIDYYHYELTQYTECVEKGLYDYNIEKIKNINWTIDGKECPMYIEELNKIAYSNMLANCMFQRTYVLLLHYTFIDENTIRI